MLASQSLGPLKGAQSDILKLAHESNLRLEVLVGRLKIISGDPDGLMPDAKILEQLY